MTINWVFVVFVAFDQPVKSGENSLVVVIVLGVIKGINFRLKIGTLGESLESPRRHRINV